MAEPPLPPEDVPAYLAERGKARQLTTDQWGWLFLFVALSIAVLSAVGRAASPEAAMSLAAIGLYLLIGYVLCRRPGQSHRFEQRYPRAAPVADPWRFTCFDRALRTSSPFMGWLLLPLGSVSLVAMARGFAATAGQALSSLIVLRGTVTAAVMNVFIVCGPLVDRLYRVIVLRRWRWTDPLAAVGYLIYALFLLLAFAIDVADIPAGA